MGLFVSDGPLRAGLARFFAVLVGITVGPAAFALETTKVLPKGVRNLNLRTVSTEFDRKSNASGTAEALGKPLAKDLTFERIAAGEEGFRETQFRAFLLSEGFNPDESAGTFTADLRGQVQVFAPIFAWGISDRLTLAAALPVYRATTAVEVGFRPSPNADRFVAALASSANNQTEKAREAADKLSNAVPRLNDKLVENGFRSLDNWNGDGVGDLTLAAKYRAFAMPQVAGAVTGGLVAPTGRVDDPDVLSDIPFGDGQWDLFGQLTFDQPVGGLLATLPGELGSAWFLNQYARYTVQLPGARDVRDVTDDEKIEVERARARVKLGDKVDLGASVNWQPQAGRASGAVAGLGYVYFRKFGDLYRMSDGRSQSVLAERSDQTAHNAEMVLGYSTIPAFQRGSFKVPLEVKATWLRQLYSENLPISDLAQIDASLFF